MSETSPQLAAILTDRYRIERQLGQGGMATVYLAHDLKLEREVALKILRPELGAVLGSERFLAEVKITARLDHPHILTLIDSGSAGGLLYYVLPYVRGESLRDLLNREQQLGVEQATVPFIRRFRRSGLHSSPYAAVAPSSTPDGWAWIPKRRNRVIVEQQGRQHEITKPAWFEALVQVDASADGSRLLLVGWNNGSGDSLGVSVVPTAGGTPAMWARTFAETGDATWLDDGSLAFLAWRGTDAVSIRRVRGPGSETMLGEVPHVATTMSVSRDLKRASLMWREYRGDAWMYRVVKP